MQSTINKHNLHLKENEISYKFPRKLKEKKDTARVTDL